MSGLVALSEDERARRRRNLLASAGWQEAEVAALAGDASFRSYQRLTQGGETRVLMDAPPPQEDVRPFVAVANWLRQYGYSAPEILGADDEAGFLLLEDLGDGLYIHDILAGADEATLYAAAIDVLADYQGREALPGIQTYSVEVLIREARLFTDWYLPYATSGPVGDRRIEEFEALWRSALSAALEVGHPVMVLRDYHAENLIWLPERSGLKRVGLLDFQDALSGSMAYDLASLLKDIRRVVSPDLAEQMLERYLAHPIAADLERQAFERAYAVIGAQRNTKIIGIFTRLSQRDGKHVYLDYLPRLWQLLAEDLAHPALTDLRGWFDAALPPIDRPGGRA
jgi:hypothetical protein